MSDIVQSSKPQYLSDLQHFLWSICLKNLFVSCLGLRSCPSNRHGPFSMFYWENHLGPLQRSSARVLRPHAFEMCTCKRMASQKRYSCTRARFQGPPRHDWWDLSPREPWKLCAAERMVTRCIKIGYKLDKSLSEITKVLAIVKPELRVSRRLVKAVMADIIEAESYRPLAEYLHDAMIPGESVESLCVREGRTEQATRAALRHFQPQSLSAAAWLQS